MKRIPTCIPGLDRLIEGGFPENSCILLAGPPGSGKSLFALQFIYKGIIDYNEPGIIMQTTEYIQTLYWYEEMLGWDLAAPQDKGKLAIYSFKPKDYAKFSPTQLDGEVLGKLRNIILPMETKRIVIDAITPLGEGLKLEDYRRSLYETIEFFKQNKLTSLIITEGKNENSHGIEEFLCDGVIRLRTRQTEKGDYAKELMVSKMIATNYPQTWYPVTISEKLGFTVRPFL